MERDKFTFWYWFFIITIITLFFMLSVNTTSAIIGWVIAIIIMFGYMELIHRIERKEKLAKKQ